MSYQSPDAAGPPKRLGRYELLGQLALGGMAEIHLARLAGEAGFEKIVVVKRLLPELVASRAYVEMFLGEAKLVAKLDHPNVCEVYELGREGAEYYLVMPFLDGVPASELISRPREPDRLAQLRVAAGVIAQACAGLHHAHELRDETGALVGLVHRDVSPSNLFVTTNGVVKVLDFGIAKIAGTAETEAGTVKGKSQYMAPEQLLGEPVDRRTDVFGLGIVLYELASHVRLFQRASDYLAARAILEDPIPRADETDATIPRALADVIARALARAPGDRFADAPALATALDQAFAVHGGVAAAAQIAAALADRHGGELTAQRTRQMQVVDRARAGETVPFGHGVATDVATHVRAPARRRRTVIAGAIGAVAVAVAIVAAMALGDRHAPNVRLPDSSVRSPDSIVRPPDSTVRVADQGSDDRDITIDPVEHAVPGVPRVRAPGWFSIDSAPFAQIYIDDRLLGVTPLVHKPLAAGRHRVRAVLSDGRVKDLAIVVPAGKLASPVSLTW